MNNYADEVWFGDKDIFQKDGKSTSRVVLRKKIFSIIYHHRKPIKFLRLNGWLRKWWMKLEANNPDCFDDPDKTFGDHNMKLGLYISEIVKLFVL